MRASGLARLDAELLLAHALGVDRGALHRAPEAEVPPEAERSFRVLAARRARSEPVAYLLGAKGFRWLELAVDSRVLVPRPETEDLVAVGVERLPRGARVVDVGTGSGAVALALASERPDLSVLAVDVSEDALAVARGNARRLGLAVEFAGGDLLDAIEGPIDAVLSNPPYVADGDVLPADVADWEPALALRAGVDGLDVIRRLVPAAAARAGFLALEVGEGQAPAVADLCRAAGLARVSVRADLAGIGRIVVAER